MKWLLCRFYLSFLWCFYFITSLSYEVIKLLIREVIIATISVKFFRNYLGAHYFDQKVQSNNFKGRSPDTVYRKEKKQ